MIVNKTLNLKELCELGYEPEIGEVFYPLSLRKRACDFYFLGFEVTVKGDTYAVLVNNNGSILYCLFDMVFKNVDLDIKVI